MRTMVLLQALRYAVLALFSIVGVYYLLWSIQSASYSVPAEPIMSEIYKTRATLYFPISILMFAVGWLAFLFLGKRSNREPSA
jgi:nitrogen fixation-related uncharacterized protein